MPFNITIEDNDLENLADGDESYVGGSVIHKILHQNDNLQQQAARAQDHVIRMNETLVEILKNKV